MRSACVWLVLVPMLALAQKAPAETAAAPVPDDPLFGQGSPPAVGAAAKADPKAPPPSDGAEPVRLRSASSNGPVGLDRAWSADTGPLGSFRLHIGLGYSKASDWPRSGHDNTFVATDYTLAYTPIRYLEAFIGLRNTSNTNDGSKPAHIATQGDLTLGLKGGHFVTDVVGVGAAASVHFLGGIDGGGPVGASTSAELRALFTFDMHRADVAPVRVLFDLSYYFENGEALYDDQPEEPDIVQDWALQAGRYDRLILGFGLEGVIEPYAAPYLEYRVGTPFLVQVERKGEGSKDFAFGSVPHTITPGVRLFPHTNVALDLGVRVGLSDQPFTGVPATLPWELFVGVGYVLDPRPTIIEREVAPPAPPPPPVTYGGVVGRVLDVNTKKAIEGASVTYKGLNISPQTTGKDGRFGGYRLEPGAVELVVTARGYQQGGGKGSVAAGSDATVSVSLKPVEKGRIEVRVFDDVGKKMGASIRLGEDVTGDATPDAPFTAEAKAGTYKLLVGTAGFADDEREVEIKSGETTSVRVPLQRGDGELGRDGKGKKKGSARRSSGAGQSKRSGAAVFTGRGIRMRAPISFVGRTAKLTPNSNKALDDLANLLKTAPEVRRLRIIGHTDNRGKSAALETLSAERAATVRSYLIKRGVARKRLSARGLGSTRPIAPNLTSRGRAKNNRIEFMILELD